MKIRKYEKIEILFWVTLFLCLCAHFYAFWIKKSLYWFSFDIYQTVLTGEQINYPRYTYRLFTLPIKFLKLFSDDPYHLFHLKEGILTFMFTFQGILAGLFSFFLLRKQCPVKYTLLIIYASGFHLCSALGYQGSLQGISFLMITLAFQFRLLREFRINDQILFFVFGILFYFSYQPMTLVGCIILLGNEFFSLNKNEPKNLKSARIRFGILLFSIIFAICFIVYNKFLADHEVHSNFKQSILALFNINLLPLVNNTLLALAAFGVIYTLNRKKTWIKWKVMTPFLFTSIIFLYHYFFSFPGREILSSQYNSRALICVVTLFWSSFACFVFHRWWDHPEQMRKSTFFFRNLCLYILILGLLIDLRTSSTFTKAKNYLIETLKSSDHKGACIPIDERNFFSFGLGSSAIKYFPLFYGRLHEHGSILLDRNTQVPPTNIESLCKRFINQKFSQKDMIEFYKSY